MHELSKSFSRENQQRDKNLKNKLFENKKAYL